MIDNNDSDTGNGVNILVVLNKVADVTDVIIQVIYVIVDVEFFIDISPVTLVVEKATQVNILGVDVAG